MPTLAIVGSGAIFYLLFPSQFDPSMRYALQEVGMIAVGRATDPLPYRITQMACALGGSLANILWNFDDESGWRAYLQQRLMPLGPRRAVLLVGVIWAAWHWPATVLGLKDLPGYCGEPVVGPLLWVWCLLPASTIYGWLTLRSGTIWPAAIAHGVNNTCARLMLWFLRGPLNVLTGPTAGHCRITGGVSLALPILAIPGAQAPTADRQPGR